MKAPVTGVIEKVGAIQEFNGKFKQDIILVEAAVGMNAKEKTFQIQNWGKTREELTDMALDERVGEQVICECYWSGYQYFSKTHGTSYGINVILYNIREVA
jgi:hypothetical protein